MTKVSTLVQTVPCIAYMKLLIADCSINIQPFFACSTRIQWLNPYDFTRYPSHHLQVSIDVIPLLSRSPILHHVLIPPPAHSAFGFCHAQQRHHSS